MLFSITKSLVPFVICGALFAQAPTAVDYVNRVTNKPTGGTGTVTSVDLMLPPEFVVSGGPVTTAGTLSGAWALQSVGLVFAGPGSGPNAQPTFRQLVGSDLPTMVGDSGGGGTKGAVPAPGPGDATNCLFGSGVWAPCSSGPGMTPVSLGGTGADLSGTGGTGQYVKQETSGGNFTAGTIPATDVPVMVGDSGSGGTQGLVPAPGTGDASKFLRGDGVFADPPGASVTLDRTRVGPMWDDFFTTTGDWGWTAAGSPSAAANIASLQNHPGILQVVSGNVNGNASIVLNPTVPIMNPAAYAGWEYMFIFRPSYSLSNNTKIRVGLYGGGTLTEATPTRGMYIRYENSTGCTTNPNSDSEWVAVSTGVDTTTAPMGVGATSNTWYTFRIRGVALNEVGFSISVNGAAFGAEQVISTNFPNGVVTPFFSSS